MANNYIVSEDKIFLGIIGGLGALIASVIAISEGVGYQKEKMKLAHLREMPDSYWEAEKVKAESSVKKHEMDLAYKERLELDKRQREADELAAKHAFELAAPPEYWESMAKQVKAKEQAKTERENARRQAEAIAKAAHEFRQAATGV